MWTCVANQFTKRYTKKDDEKHNIVALKCYKCMCFEEFSRHVLRTWLCIMWRIFCTCLPTITVKVKTNHSVDTEVLIKIFSLGYSSEFFLKSL